MMFHVKTVHLTSQKHFEGYPLPPTSPATAVKYNSGSDMWWSLRLWQVHHLGSGDALLAHSRESRMIWLDFRK